MLLSVCLLRFKKALEFVQLNKSTNKVRDYAIIKDMQYI